MPRTLKPIVTHDSWHFALEEDLKAFFKQLIFEPILSILDEDEKENSVEKSYVIAALKSGKITLTDGGLFRGAFTANISRELKTLGAKWDLSGHGFRLSPVPADIMRVAQTINARRKRLVDAINDRLDAVKTNVTKYIKNLNLGKRALENESKVSEKFRTTVTKEIGLTPTINEADRLRLEQEYIHNLELSIVEVSERRTANLRETVIDYVNKGQPREELRRQVKASLRVSNHRAKFIARQETSLYTSKVKQIQYQNVGIEKYVWKAILDSRVRPEHKLLNGTVQSWDDPPIGDEKTKQRGHPGTFFGCRCLASPVVEFKE